ncbi:unnamed protein product [Laminaria digitata]
MEYYLPIVMILLVLRYGVPPLTVWFVERFVEPKTKANRDRDRHAHAALPKVEFTNAQKVIEVRENLDELKRRLA